MFKKIFSLFLIILLTNCTTSAPYRISIVPNETIGQFLNGKQIFIKKNKRIEYLISYERIENEQLLFHVKITNKSRNKILVDPSNFIMEIPYYSKTKIYKNSNDYYNSGNFGKNKNEEKNEHEKYKYEFSNNFENSLILNVKSINPEIMISQIEEKINSEQAAHNTTQAIDTACMMTGCLFGIAGAAAGDEKAMDNSIYMMNDTIELSEKNNQNHRAKLDIMENEKKNLELNSLRKTTLSRNESVSGLVYFPFIKKAQALQIKLMVSKSIVNFMFSQAEAHDF